MPIVKPAKFKGQDISVRELTVTELDDILANAGEMSMIDRIFDADLVTESMLSVTRSASKIRSIMDISPALARMSSSSVTVSSRTEISWPLNFAGLTMGMVISAWFGLVEVRPGYSGTPSMRPGELAPLRVSKVSSN